MNKFPVPKLIDIFFFTTSAVMFCGAMMFGGNHIPWIFGMIAFSAWNMFIAKAHYLPNYRGPYDW
jgi:hypothetical protein